MFKTAINLVKFVVFGFICQFSQTEEALALDIEIAPFALYEQGQESITINGVKTKYGLGAVGVSIETMLGKKFKIGTRLGYGYHPNASVSLTDSVTRIAVDVKGPVSGIYLGAGVDYLLWSKIDNTLRAELTYLTRNINAPDLLGFANSRAISGSAVNDFDTLDLLFDAKFRISEAVFLNIAVGLSQWNLTTTATARSETGGRGPIRCPCSVTMRIDTTSIDPVLSVAITSDNPLQNFEFEVYGRSLESKAGTKIFGLEFGYNFQF